MIYSSIFQIKNKTDEIIFNSAIIDISNSSYILIIDKKAKRYKTYKNLFFILLSGKYKIDFIDNQELKDEKFVGDYTEHSILIDEKSPFKNIKKYIETNYENTFNYNFNISPTLDNEEYIKFCDKFGNDEKELIVIDFNNNILIDEKLKLIAPYEEKIVSIKNIFKKISNLYSKVVFILETFNKIDFEYLTQFNFSILKHLEEYISNLIEYDKTDPRLVYSLRNKCIETSIFILKDEKVINKMNITKDTFQNIQNIQINEDNIKKVSTIKKIFDNNHIKNMLLEYSESIQETNKNDNSFSINLEKNNLDIKQLEESIKIFNDQKAEKIAETKETVFFIDGVSGLSANFVEYTLIDTLNKQKYFKKFENGNDSNSELRDKLFQVLIQNRDSGIKAKIKYKKKNIKGHGKEIIDIEILEN